MIVLLRIQDTLTPLPLWVILIISACFYMDMNCFRPVRVVTSLLRIGTVAADILGWVVADGFGQLRMVSSGFWWFWMVSGGLLFQQLRSTFSFSILISFLFQYFFKASKEQVIINELYIKIYMLVFFGDTLQQVILRGKWS